MVKKIKIAIPVMLQYEKEIEAFLSAKPRLEKLLSDKGYDAEVGVFLYLIRNCLKPEAITAQINNQIKYKLPIFHAQLPVAYEYSLHPQTFNQIDYEENSTNLNFAATHAAKIISLSNSEFKPSLDAHPGVYIFPNINQNTYPGTFSSSDYIKNKKLLEDKSKNKFNELITLLGENDLKINLENEPLANYEFSLAHNGDNKLIYKPFGDPEKIQNISGGRNTFDSNHFAATLSIPKRFTKNKINPKTFFEILEISNWDEYREKFCNINSYLNNNTKTIHFSNTEGIGIHLKDSEDIRKWGADGTTEGVLSKQDLQKIFNFGVEKKIPIVMEVDFDIKKIPENKFIEADSFLNYVLPNNEYE